MTVHADGDLHHLFDLAYHVVGGPGIQYANCVGDAHVIGAVIFGLFVERLQKPKIGPGGIFCREPNDQAMILSIFQGIISAAYGLVAAHVELVFQV